jgi:hypothetical protein
MATVTAASEHSPGPGAYLVRWLHPVWPGCTSVFVGFMFLWIIPTAKSRVSAKFSFKSHICFR